MDMFNTLRLEVRLVRDLERADSAQECCIHRWCEPLQIGLPQVLSRGPHLDLEALQ